MTQLVSMKVQVKGARLAKLMIRIACPLIKLTRKISPRAATAVASFTMAAIPKLIRVRAA